jgi:hypothetical protein
MCRQRNIHNIIHLHQLYTPQKEYILPLRMMIEFLGSESDARHESPCLVEVGEFQGAGETRFIGVGFPLGEIGEEVRTFCGGEEDGF